MMPALAILNYNGMDGENRNIPRFLQRAIRIDDAI
jgi:hypothetical protein